MAADFSLFLKKKCGRAIGLALKQIESKTKDKEVTPAIIKRN
jgi:hypothetical protein